MDSLSGGEALSASARAYFEPRFGRDFSDVRIHTGSKAAKSAKAVNAKAFTLGPEIVFGLGEYSPESSEGKKLLAHELTHIIQQSSDPHNPQIVREHHTAEKEASAASQKFVLEEQVFSPSIRLAPLIQRASAADAGQLDAEGDIAAERFWTKQNPAGMVECWSDEDRWILWNFDVTSTQLKPEHKKALVKIAKEWWPLTKRYFPSAKIHISGHASQTGLHEKNTTYAQQRAEVIKEFLASYLIEDQFMVTDSYSDFKPVVGGADPRSLAINRSVEIVFEYEKVKQEPGATQIDSKGSKSGPVSGEIGPLDAVIPEEIRPEEHSVIESAEDTVTEAGAHVVSEITEGGGLLGGVAVPYALYRALKLQVELIESVQKAQEAGKRLSAVKAASYMMVALAKNIPIPNVPLREQWGNEEKEEWDHTLQEVKREVTWKVNEYKDYKYGLKRDREKRLRSKEYQTRMIEAAKIAGSLEILAGMSNEEALNCVFQAISGESALESHLKW